MREKTIETLIRVALNEQGVMVKKNRIEACWQCGAKPRLTDGMGVGSSDLIACIPPSGRFMAIEVKSATGRLSSEQERFLIEVRKHGGLAGVCKSAEEAMDLYRLERWP